MKIVVFDSTDVAPIAIPRVERRDDGTAVGTGGLTRWWRIGAGLYRAMGFDAARGCASWEEALEWAVAIAKARGAAIEELQAWGHGGWGFMRMGESRLDVDALARSHAMAPVIDALRGVLRSEAAGSALVWLRCCSAFGDRAGRSFAPALADRLDARVAGHTFIIGGWQSGLHSIARGQEARWANDEGVETRGAQRVAQVSSRRAPNTIHCLRPAVPSGW